MTEVFITTKYITLAQFLKHVNIVSSGGEVKVFLHHYQVVINGVLDNRRGKKLFEGDKLKIEDFGEFVIRK